MVCSEILSSEPLSSLSKAYALITQEEIQQLLRSSIKLVVEVAAFAFRSKTNTRFKSKERCAYCHKPGHLKSECFKPGHFAIIKDIILDNFHILIIKLQLLVGFQITNTLLKLSTI